MPYIFNLAVYFSLLYYYKNIMSHIIGIYATLSYYDIKNVTIFATTSVFCIVLGHSAQTVVYCKLVQCTIESCIYITLCLHWFDIVRLKILLRQSSEVFQ